MKAIFVMTSRAGRNKTGESDESPSRRKKFQARRSGARYHPAVPRSMTFKVAVCDVPAELSAGSAAWRALCDASNRVGTAVNGQVLGGAGWIIDPSGDVVAETYVEE